MILETIPCWLIPLLTGLISAILGYLLGRLAVSKWKDKASKLQDDLDVCKKARIKLESDLKVANAISNNTSVLESEKAELEETITDLELQIAALNENAKLSDNIIATWKDRVVSLESNLKSTHQTKESLEFNFNSFKEQANEDANGLKLQISSLEKALEDSKHKINEIPLTGADNEAEVWKKRVSDLQKELISTKTKMSSLKREIEVLKEAKTQVAPTIQNTSSIASSLTEVVAFNADAAKLVFGKKIKQDDLTIIEGIGPKIQELFHDFGVKTWAALSECSVEKCQEVLSSGGPRFKMHKPTTWPQQAGFAAQGKWKELKRWQDELDGGL